MTESAPAYDALERRDPAEREACPVRRAAGDGGARAGTSAGLRRYPARRRRGSVTSRACAGLAAGDARRPCSSCRRPRAAAPMHRTSPSAVSRQSAGRRSSRPGARGHAAFYQSPGPIYEPEGQALDYWRIARALFAAGFRAGDLIHNSFSYHMTPGAFMMESARTRSAALVFAGGVGNTELQLQAMTDLRPGLHRHAELPEDPARQGRRDRRGAALAARRWSGEVSLAAAKRLAVRPRRARLPVLCHRRRRPDRLRDRGARMGSSSTRA